MAYAKYSLGELSIALTIEFDYHPHYSNTNIQQLPS